MSKSTQETPLSPMTETTAMSEEKSSAPITQKTTGSRKKSIPSIIENTPKTEQKNNTSTRTKNARSRSKDTALVVQNNAKKEQENETSARAKNALSRKKDTVPDTEKTTHSSKKSIPSIAQNNTKARKKSIASVTEKNTRSRKKSTVFVVQNNTNAKKSISSTRDKKLTPKQALFVQEYLVDLNAYQAALRAGYRHSTATIASAFLKKAPINEAINKALAMRCTRIEITQDKVLKELALIAFSDVRSIAEWTGDSLTLKSSDTLLPEHVSLIKEISTATTNKIKIKLHNKLKALELLARHLGMFNDKLSLSGGVDISLLEQARERAKNKE